MQQVDNVYSTNFVKMFSNSYFISFFLLCGYQNRHDDDLKNGVYERNPYYIIRSVNS